MGSAVRSALLLVARPQSYRVAPYLQAARGMGLQTLLASSGEHSLIREIHDAIQVDLDDLDGALGIILKAVDNHPVCGVVGCDDSTVELAAALAERLGLPHNPPHAARLSRRKDLARAQLQAHGCAVPAHHLLDLTKPLPPQLHAITYPCVVKPVHLSASRGVIRADDPAGLLSACERIRPMVSGANDSIEASRLLVEHYIDGVEVAYEGYLDRGELHTLALFDKPLPLQGPFFEESIYVTPSHLSERQQQTIRQRVAEACHAYGLTTGPVHAELRIDQRDAWILEVASRTIGGECGRTLDSGGEQGYSVEEVSIALACGRRIAPKLIEGSRGVMMIPIPGGGILQRVEGVAAASQCRFIEQVKIIIDAGHELVPLPEGDQYAGYIFARAETPQQVVEALQQAHRCLRFVIAPLWRLSAR